MNRGREPYGRNLPEVITRTVWFEAGRFRTNKHEGRLPLENHEIIHEGHFHTVNFHPPKGVYQVIYQRSERGDCEVCGYKRARLPGVPGAVQVCFLHPWAVGTRFFRYVVV